jgi:DNA adenine methylase
MYQPQLFSTGQLEEHKLPLFRWAGGKRSLLKHLLPLLPDSYGTYYEPFFGGGALFFALQPQVAVLSDLNPDLINCYRQVRDRPNEVIEHLGRLKNTREDYYSIREQIPADEVGKAARLIYLVRLSFNGIYRLNSAGKFNVPYGNRLMLQPCDPERILLISAALSRTELVCQDFEEAVRDASVGDVVYLDPPYTVAHGNNGFLQYNAKIFSWNDQERLYQLAKNLASRQCKVIVSNADHTSIRSLYEGFQVKTVARNSLIAASGSSRRQITECIFHNEV